VERPAASIASFLEEPDGRYLRGENYLCGCDSAGLYVIYVWGNPGAAEMKRAIAAFSVQVRPEAVPHLSYFDCRGLTGVERSAFVVLRDFWMSIAPLQEKLVQKQALIRPGGYVGALVAGFYHVFKPPYPCRTFSDGVAGLEWLGLPPSLMGRWERARHEGGALLPELAGLRDLLERTPALDIEAAARRIGVSSRTLQRRLAVANTSFRDERDRCRLQVARARLVSTDSKLEAIASDLGFDSPQHFAGWFRDRTGALPSVYRAEQRPRAE
jgi:AraC-like DNA-binding protein